MEDISLADIKAVVGEGGLNGSLPMYLLLFVLIFGWGGNGFGNRNNFGDYATAASQTEILLGQQFQNLDNKIDRIGNGICDSTFALNNSIKDGNAAVTGNVVSEGRSLQQQISDCCCEQRANTDSVRYDMANFACSINQNIDNKFAALEKSQMQAQIDAQAQQLNQLYIAQQLCGVVRYPNATTYNAGNSCFGTNSCCNGNI